MMRTPIRRLDTRAAGFDAELARLQHWSAQTDAAIEERVADVLRRAGGNKTRAAKMLGISRVTLWRRLRELQLVDAGGAARLPRTSIAD